MARVEQRWNEHLRRPVPDEALLTPFVADPCERCRRIESEPLPQSILEILIAAADEVPDQIACHFIESGTSITYAEFRAKVAALAHGFSRIGIAKGAHVGVMLPNIVEFPITWFAIATLGAVMVPINISYTQREFEYVAQDADIEFLVATETYAEGAASNWLSRSGNEQRLIVCSDRSTPTARGKAWSEVLSSGSENFTAEPRQAYDLLNIQYTSGTTGFPKGCMLTHQYWVVAGKANAFRDGLAYDRILASTPFYYMDPQWLLLMSMYHRATLFVALRQSATRFMDWVRRHRIQFCLFPQAVMLQPTTPEDDRNELRRANVYGLRASAHMALEERFCLNAREAFGMTETGPAMFMPLSAVDMIGSGSCGIPGPFRECRIVSDDGTDAAIGQLGELLVRGPGVLAGYYRNEDATKAALDDGWFRTGDIFRQDSNGYFYIVGRKKDMIRRSSENIPAREVEAVVQEIAGVAEVAAVAVPDELRGEEVKVYVVLSEGSDPKDVSPDTIIAHAALHLAPFKVPRYIEYRSEIPRTPSGKIRKHELASEKTDLRRDSWDRLSGAWL